MIRARCDEKFETASQRFGTESRILHPITREERQALDRAIGRAGGIQ